MAKENDTSSKQIASNKRARFEYEILERVEAGIVLTGTEVKSVRNGKVSINEAYARVQQGEIWLINMDIAEYAQRGYASHEPKRPRKLLLHKRQIDKLVGKTSEKGLTLIPLGVHFNRRGIAKISLGVARGKQQFDKRRSIRDREQKREVQRAMRKR